MKNIYCEQFDNISTGRPYMIYPNVFNDNRGTFSEVLKNDNLKEEHTSC